MLARAVVAELQRQGYETYEEVSTGWGGRRADVVGVRGAVVMVVECKRAMSLRFLDQLCAWRGHASYVVGAYEDGKRSVSTRRLAEAEGFGLWRINGDWFDVQVVPRLCRSYLKGLRESLTDEQRSGSQYAKAGTKDGGYYTPFGRTSRELTDLVKKNPGIALRAALKELSHHYASDKSAMSALPKLIRRGVVRGIRIDENSRALLLWPAEEAQ